jgi:hypothetical protein
MRGGKPCIGGMRITVYDVLEYLTSVWHRKRSWQIFLASPNRTFLPVSFTPLIATSS